MDGNTGIRIGQTMGNSGVSNEDDPDLTDIGLHSRVKQVLKATMIQFIM